MRTPFLLVALAALPLWCVTSGSAQEIHINVGGPQLVARDGTIFLEDGPYTPQRGYGWESGSDYDDWRTVGGCADPELYQTTHHNCGIYRLDVADSSYVLTLHFTDMMSHGVGQYAMGWRVNGQLVLNHLDVYAEVGRDYAVDYRFAVTVTNGQVLLDDIPQPRTQLAALSLVPHAPDSEPPAVPQLTEILPGFGEVILNWQPNAEQDLRGYEVHRRPLSGGPVVTLQNAEYLVSRYVDREVVPGVTYQYWISAVDVYGNTSSWGGPWAASAQPMTASPLPLCQITIDPDSLAALNEDPWTEHYFPCTVELQGTPYTAGLRYRGNVVRTMSKKSYKIKLDSGQVFEGRKKLNCTSSMCDPCLMRESLSMGLFPEAGVPAPRTWWRAVTLNGEYMGAYCDVEQLDERFLEAHGLDPAANIYKCDDRLVILPDSTDYPSHYEKETNEDGSWDDLITFIEALNLTPDEEFYETFIDDFDFDEYLSYFAVLMLINDGDAIYKNFELYHDLDDDRWMILPWDKDLSWGIRWIFDPAVYYTSGILQGASPSQNVLAHRVFTEPLFMNLYASRVYELITERFPVETLAPIIAAAHAQTEANGEVDVRKWFWEDNTRLRQGAAELSDFIANREACMLDQLASIVRPQELYINEFMAANTMTLADEYGEYEDWIEIHNPGPLPISLQGYYLTDQLADPIQWPFPDTTLAPGGFLIVWADEDGEQGPLHAGFKLSRNGELIALHKREAGAVEPVGPDDIDPVDLVYFGAQSDDVSQSRLFDDDYRWCRDTSPTPGTYNVDPQGLPDDSSAKLTDGSLRTWRISANPFHDRIVLSLSPGLPDARLEIVDVNGRICRHLPAGGGTTTEWIWDRRSDDGRAVSPGVYWARVSGGPHPVRLLLVR